MKVSKNKKWNNFYIGDEVKPNRKVYCSETINAPDGGGIIVAFHNRCHAEILWNKTGTSTIISAMNLGDKDNPIFMLKHIESCYCGKCVDWEDNHQYPPCEEKMMDRFRDRIGEYDWDYTTIRAMMGMDL